MKISQNFTHLVMLKRPPFYVYAQNEADAIKVFQAYKDSAIAVVEAPEGLIVKLPEVTIQLRVPDVKFIDVIQDKDLDKIGITQDDIDSLIKQEDEGGQTQIRSETNLSKIDDLSRPSSDEGSSSVQKGNA